MNKFTTFINGVKHQTIGFYNPGVLSLIINEVTLENRIKLELGGLEILPDGSKKNVEWEGVTLKIGDEVLIRISEEGSADSPKSERIQEPGFERKQKEKYLEQLKAELRSGGSTTE